MGSYIYGRTQQIKTAPKADGGTIDINLAKYLYKPVRGGYSAYADRIEAQQEALSARYDRAWEDKELPRYVVVADTFAAYPDHEVFDTSTRKCGMLPSTFWDSGEYGDVVGTLRKVSGRWLFIAKSK